MTTPTACSRCGAVTAGGDVFCRRCGARVLPVAGWYPNPDGTGGLRYWDGTGWTGHTHVSQVVRAAPATPTVDAGPRALRGVGVAFLGFGAGVGAGWALLAGLRNSDVPGGEVTAFCLSELVLWAGMLGAVLFVSRRRGTGRLARDFGLRLRDADLGIGAVGAVVGRSAAVMVTIPLYAAFHELLRNPSVGLPASEINGAMLVAYAVAACVGAPVVEELFFRGLIQTRLVDRWGPVRGIAVTSALFGAAHLIGWRGPASILAATAIGVSGSVLGYLRHRTGRLGTSMVAHALFNAVAVLLLAAGVGR